MQFSASNTLNVSPQTTSVWSSTPTIAFSASRLDFGAQSVGTSSPPKSIALTNEGNAPLSIAKIVTTGNFAQTNNCIGPFAIGQGCTVNATFTPTANGASNGSLSLTDNSSPGTQGLTLTGWAGPPDFSLSVAPSSHSIAAGSNASYILTVDPSGGFSGTVQLACTGAPSKATCTLAKTSVPGTYDLTLSGTSGSTTHTMTITLKVT